MKPIVQFALATGCRAGEIHGLEWSRVDLARRVAWLDHGTTKSGEGRGIPLNADAVAALEATRGQHRRWFFTFAGQRIHQRSTAWDKAKQRAGIEDFRFHDLKHTFGRRLRAAGVSFEDRQDLLGHKSGRITTHYSQAELTSLIEAADRVCSTESRKSPATTWLRRKMG